MSVSGNYIVDPAQGYDDEAARKSLAERSESLISKAWADKSGLGTVAGVSVAAVLAYMALKVNQNRSIAKAVHKGIPVNMNIVNPLAAALGGVGAGIGGKYLWDKYNNKEDELVY